MNPQVPGREKKHTPLFCWLELLSFWCFVFFLGGTNYGKKGVQLLFHYIMPNWAPTCRKVLEKENLKDVTRHMSSDG